MKLNWKKMSGVIAVAVALQLMAVVAVFSQHSGPNGPPPGPPPGGFFGGPGGPGGHNLLGPMTQDLSLTDDQKAQIQKLQDSFDTNTKSLRDQMKTLHDSEADQLTSGTFDEAAVRAAAQARANVQVELEVAHARVMSQVYNVLTSDQKTQLAAKRQEMQQRRQQWESQHKQAASSN